MQYTTQTVYAIVTNGWEHSHISGLYTGQKINQAVSINKSLVTIAFFVIVFGISIHTCWLHYHAALLSCPNALPQDF